MPTDEERKAIAREIAKEASAGMPAEYLAAMRVDIDDVDAALQVARAAIEAGTFKGAVARVLRRSMQKRRAEYSEGVAKLLAKPRNATG